MKFIRVIQAEEKIPAVEYRNMHDAIHHLVLFNEKQDAIDCFEKMKKLDDLHIEDQEEYDMYIEDAFKKGFDDIEVDYKTIQKDPKYDIVNKNYLIDF